MYPFGGMVVAAVAAGYLAAMMCRLSWRWGKRPGWTIRVVAALAGFAAAMAATFRGDLLRPAQLLGKVDAPFMLVIAGVPALVTAAIAAVWAVRAYGQKPAAERSSS